MTRHPQWRHFSGGVIPVLLVSSLWSGMLLASPARAGLVSRDPLDPVIDTLPPRPAPYVPYTGDICRSGSNSCIDKTIRR